MASEEPLSGGRRNNDHYGAAPETWATRELLRLLDISYGCASFLEPCAGQGNIAAALAADGHEVRTNDIDAKMPTQSHLDAFNADLYDPQPQWIVTNPPFNLAPLLVPIWHRDGAGQLAVLLRISYLEPVGNRWQFLTENPPDALYVLPRMSFTGDGKTDVVTAAWFVWSPYILPEPGIRVLSPKSDNGRLL